MTNTPAPTDGPGTEDVLALAAIIIEVQGGNRLGAGALAEAILSHPCSRWLPATSEASHTVEPPGCPMPGACSCPIERSPDAGLVRLLQQAEAELPAAHGLAGQIRLALDGWDISVAPPVCDDNDLSIVALLLWALWNHQGGHSPVGQAIRKYLGMGQFENMALKQVEAAKKYEEQLFSAPPGHQEALDTALKSLETNHDLD